MKKFLVILFLFVLIPTFSFGITDTDQEEKKNYDFSLSLAGGNVGNKAFSLFGSASYAKKFNSGLFVQASGMMNINNMFKEYGSSFGIGLEPGKIGFYVFLESLYRDGMWSQIRPVLRLNFDWLSLSAFYAEPLQKKSLMIDGQPVEMLKYWGGEVNIVPVRWAKIYVDALFVGDDHNRLRLSAEVRIFPWLALMGGWSKTTSRFYSNLNNHSGPHFQLNFHFGAQQQDYRMYHNVSVTPHYPMLVYGKKKIDHSPQYREIKIIYNSGDTSSINGRYKVVIYWDLWESSKDGSDMQHQGSGIFTKTFPKVRIQTAQTSPTHWIQIVDGRLSGVPYPDISKIEIIGADPTSIWVGGNGLIYFRAAKK